MERSCSFLDRAAKELSYIQSTLLSTMKCPSIGVKGAVAAGICTVALISACVALTVHLTVNRDSPPGTKLSKPELIVNLGGDTGLQTVAVTARLGFTVVAVMLARQVRLGCSKHFTCRIPIAGGDYVEKGEGKQGY